MAAQDTNFEARQAILTFVEGQASLSEAVNSLIKAVRMPDGRRIDGYRIWTASLELFEISLNHPGVSDQRLENLVEFVRALRERPEANEEGVSENAPDMTLWRNITMTAREMWNSKASVTAEQWRNLQAFFALLWARDVLPSYSLYAIWCLRAELEEEPESKNDIKILASQAYIHHVGHRMFKSQEVWDFNRPGDPKSGNPALAGSLLKGQQGVVNGYSAARWSFWKQRLETIAQTASIEEETRQTARQALSEMEQAEALQ